MTLEDKIKNAEEEAKEQDKLCKRYDDASEYYRNYSEAFVSMYAEKCLKCFECAKEYRQLAEWLKDYKRLLEQEPCDDAISRQSVLDEAFEVDTKEYSRIEVVGVDAINSLPTVTSQPKTGNWIPVSERLPKEFESVLVCYKSQGGIAQTVSERLTNMDGSNRWSALAGAEPVAWMPLPEPYKAESEDKE